MLAKYGQNHDLMMTASMFFLLAIFVIYNISVFLFFFLMCLVHSACSGKTSEDRRLMSIFVISAVKLLVGASFVYSPFVHTLDFFLVHKVKTAKQC